MASFEILTTEGIGWHREKIWPIATKGPGVSDLLLYRPRELVEPDSFLAAAALMLPSTTLTEEDGATGVYWETYGLEAGQPVEFEVEIRSEGGGLIDRLRRLLPGGPEDAPGRLAWSETAGEDGFGRAIVLDLGNLGAGSHTLVLRARQAGGEAVETTRALTVPTG